MRFQGTDNDSEHSGPPVIRLADQGDAVAISLLAVLLTEKYIAGLFEPEAAVRLLDSMTAQSISGYMAKGYRYHVAEDQSGITGVVGTCDNSHLYHLFVAEQAQGAGLATRLWKIARQACIDSGNKGFFTVRSSRNAQGFYQKMGFVRQREYNQGGIISIAMELSEESGD